MDRLDELAIFVAVVQQGSLAAAGRKLRRSAPAITRAIAALEQRFGTRLVERTTRRLAPTEAGVRLLERAQQLLQDYQAVVQDTAEAQLSGLLRVTSPVQFGRRYVAPVVMAFLDDYPQMQIEMVLNDRNLDLIDEGLDIAVRIGHLQDSSRVARRLGQVSRVTVASPAYLARCGEPRSPAQLAEHATIVGTQRPSLREWRFGPQENGERVRLAPGCCSTMWKRSCWRCAPARASPGCSRIRWRTMWPPVRWCGCWRTMNRCRCRCSWWRSRRSACR